MTKQELKEKALNHHELMQWLFHNAIEKSIFNTEILYSVPVNFGPSPFTPKITVIQKTTVEAILENSGGSLKTDVLNFASFTKPGGGFLKGSIAQEESLCHASYLYEVLYGLNARTGVYKKNSLVKNNGLYKDVAIYSPDIIFSDDPNSIGRKCNVITCAAPNLTVALQKGVSASENYHALSKRIELVLSIPTSKTDVLILGAWGCGVFGQNPFEVANIFRRYIKDGYCKAQHIIFAIPDGKTYNTFKKIMEEE